MTTTTTQEELSTVVKAWKKGTVEHLLITGIPGTGKTYTVSKTVKEAEIVPSSSPFELYKQLAYMSGRGVKLAVLDDMDITLFKGGRAADLLKQLLREGQRKVTWKSSRTGRRAGVPDEFTTDMRICLITNYVGKGNEHVRAIADRCFEAEHLPRGKDVYALCEKAKIVPAAFLEEMKKLAPNPLYLSIRQVMRLHKSSTMGLDWQEDFKKYLREMAGLV